MPYRPPVEFVECEKFCTFALKFTDALIQPLMTEQLKHECGIAMIKLRKPLEYYKDKYGTYLYGLNLLYLLMEKQHNRGQEAAGVGCVYRSRRGVYLPRACPGQ